MDVFDSLLTLEDDYYKEGYGEGYRDGKRAGYLEGKQFGVQTGYQRFTSIGILQGRLHQWRVQNPQNDKLAKHLDHLEKLLSNVPMTNSEQDVVEFEKNLKKAKAKTKVIVSLLKEDSSRLKIYDDSVNLRDTEEVIEDFQ